MPRRVLRASATCRAIIGRPAEAGLALCKFQRLRLSVEWEQIRTAEGRLHPNEPKPGALGTPGCATRAKRADEIFSGPSITR